MGRGERGTRTGERNPSRARSGPRAPLPPRRARRRARSCSASRRTATVEAISGHADQGGGAYIRDAACGGGHDCPSSRAGPVRYGTTAEALRDPGAGGSRTTTMDGHAAIDGSLTLRDKLEELAAEVMGWPAGQVRLEHDEFVVRQTESDAIVERAPFNEVAARIATGPVVEAVGAYDPADHHSEDGADYNFIAHMIEVEVDPDTGHVRPIAGRDHGRRRDHHQPDRVPGPARRRLRLRLRPGDDRGAHPRGRQDHHVEPGRVQAADADGHPARSHDSAAAEVGPGPFGAKSVGENTNIGVGGAIANAVFDAVGVRVNARRSPRSGFTQRFRRARAERV